MSGSKITPQTIRDSGTAQSVVGILPNIPLQLITKIQGQEIRKDAMIKVTYNLCVRNTTGKKVVGQLDSIEIVNRPLDVVIIE